MTLKRKYNLQASPCYSHVQTWSFHTLRIPRLPEQKLCSLSESIHLKHSSCQLTPRKQPGAWYSVPGLGVWGGSSDRKISLKHKDSQRHAISLPQLCKKVETKMMNKASREIMSPKPGGHLLTGRGEFHKSHSKRRPQSSNCIARPPLPS